jgi:hypothetical protein
MRAAIPIAAVASLLVLPPSGGAQEPLRASYSDQFTTEQPGASAGRELSVDFFDPHDPEGKPPSVRRIELELHPDKTRIVYCKDADRRGDHEGTLFTFLGYTFRPRLAKTRRPC